MKEIARQGGALLVLCAFVCGAFHRPAAQTLPPWSNTDIGSPPAGGNVVVSPEGEMTVTGAGAIGGTRDEFQFVYQLAAGDVVVTVRVNAVDAADPGARAGIMIRNGLTTGARHAFISVSQDGAVAFETRHGSREHARRTESGGGAVPLWLRLVRQGNEVTAYRSSDGVSWIPAGGETIDMRAHAFVGIAVGSGSADRPATAMISKPTIASGGRLPEPWATRQVGHTLEPGTAEMISNAFHVHGGGSGIGGTVDQFRYVFQRASGDVEIIAKLASLVSSTDEAFAGVMIRSNLDAGATHAAIVATLQNGWEFTRRPWQGGASLQTAGSSGQPPGWMKLIREGDLFSAYYSSDGLNWTLSESESIAMPQEVQVGLVVASDSLVTLASAIFTSVIVRSPVVPNEPPMVILESPDDGQQFDAGASIAIEAGASDPDGAVARVDFYRGSTLLKSDSTAPYSATWKGATPGTHAIFAVARDIDGAIATATLSVIVGSTPSPPASVLLFTPSEDHAKQVSFYWLAVFRESDPLSAPPVAQTNLGKPEPVEGEISVDVSTLIGGLEAGSYKVVVTAVGPGGFTASAPSPGFAR
jgi:regulation of enolase protein 1 (concanavalin A-like superfamily)